MCVLRLHGAADRGLVSLCNTPREGFNGLGIHLARRVLVGGN
jgi:hypothetical protein